MNFPNNVFKSDGGYICFISEYNGNNKPSKLPFNRIVGFCFKIVIYHIRQYLSVFWKFLMKKKKQAEFHQQAFRHVFRHF